MNRDEDIIKQTIVKIQKRMNEILKRLDDITKRIDGGNVKFKRGPYDV